MSCRAAARPAAGQSGMTLVETLMGLALIVLLVVPVMAWGQFAVREQGAVEDRSLAATGVGLVRTYVSRDITSADAAFVAGTALVDCRGGSGAATPLLVLATGAARTTYTVAPGEGGAPALWRRSCATAGGPVTDEQQVVGNLAATGGATATCRTSTASDGSCPYVNLLVVGADGEQVSVTAAVRVTGTAPGVTTVPARSVPTVVVTATPTTTTRGTQVSFSSAGSGEPGGGALSFAWELGNGTTASGPTATATYTTLGPVTAVLTVTSSTGVPSTEFVTVQVVNRPPVAVIAAPPADAEFFRGQPVAFSSAGSGDAGDAPYGGAVTGYRWDLGNATTSTDANPTTSYGTLSPAGGTTVALTVTDDAGATARTERRIRIVNRVPTVSLAANRTSGGSPLTVVLTPTVTDETTMGANPPLAYSWSLGTGASPASSTSAGPLTVTYTGNGTRTARVTVTDDAGATATATVNITVGTPPTAAFTLSPTSGQAPRAVNITNSSTTTSGTIDAWEWDFGNGQTSTQQQPPNVTFTYNDPAADTFISHTYTVTLRVRANGIWSNPATRTVTITGSPAPTGLRRISSSGTGQNRTLRMGWNASNAANRYQAELCGPGTGCRTQEVTATEATFTGLRNEAHTLRVRSRDANTGKWGAWSTTLTGVRP